MNKLESLLIKVKEESEKFGLKFNIQNTKIMASGPITSQQIDFHRLGKHSKMFSIDWETVTDFIFLGSKVIVDGDYSHETKDVCSLEEKL